MQWLTTHIKKYQATYLLILLAIMAYWPISLGLFVLRYDALDITFPYKYLISTYVENGRFPLWNPHIQLGLPILSDPGNSVHYPFYWLNLLLTGYGLAAHQWDLVIHLIIAGMGMYRLLRFLKVESRVALLFSAVYMLNGAFLANAQHMGWVISASWMSWVIYYYLKVWKDRSDESAVKLGLVSYLLLVSAYPVFFLILVTILVPWTVIRISRSGLKKISWRSLLFLVIAFFPLADAYFESWLDGMQAFNRGGGLDIEAILAGSLQPLGFLTMIAPRLGMMADPSNQTFLASMNQMYFGFIPFLCVILYFLIPKKKVLLSAFLAIGGLCLLIALGDLFPFRRWLAEVPGYDSFKFPSIFRHVALVFLLPVAAFAFQFLSKNRQLIKQYKLAIIGVIISLQLVVLYLLIPYFATVAATSLGVLLFILVPLIKVLSILGFIFGKGVLHRILPYLILADMLLFVQGGMTFYGVTQTSVSDFQEHVNSFGQTYEEAPVDRPLLEMNTYSDSTFAPMVFNSCFITKEFAHDGFYPLQLNTLAALESDKNYWKILEQPLFFVSRSIEGIPDTVGQSAISDVDYFPSEVSLNVESSEDAYFVFSQNIHQGWSAEINDKNVPLDTAFHTLMAVPIKAGKSQIHFKFRDDIFRFYKSQILFWVLFIALIFFEIKARYFAK